MKRNTRKTRKEKNETTNKRRRTTVQRTARTVKRAPARARVTSPASSNGTMIAPSRDISPEPVDMQCEESNKNGDGEEDFKEESKNKKRRELKKRGMGAKNTKAPINPDQDEVLSQAPTVVVEEVDGSIHVEAAKAAGVKVRDFYYEMKRSNSFLSPVFESEAMPSAASTANQDLSRKPSIHAAPLIINARKIYLQYRLAHAFHHMPELLQKYSFRPEPPTVGLVYLLNIGWVKLVECDWRDARQALGEGLLQFAQNPHEFLVCQIPTTLYPTEEEVEGYIECFPKPVKEIKRTKTADDERYDGPFGMGLLHLLDNEVLEEIHKEIVRVDEEGEGAKENLDHIWAMRKGRTAEILFRPLLQRMRTPFVQKVRVDAAPTVAVSDPKEGEQENEENVGRKRKVQSNTKSATGPSQKRQKFFDSRTIEPPPAPASPSNFRQLRTRAYRTDAPTVGKKRGKKCVNSVETYVGPDFSGNDDAADATCVGKGKERAHESDANSLEIKPPQIKPAACRPMDRHRDTPTPEAEEHVVDTHGAPATDNSAGFWHNPFDAPSASTTRAPSRGLGRTQTFAYLGEPSRRR